MNNSSCSNASNLEIKSFDPKQMKADGRRKRSGEGVEKADQKKAKRATSWNTKAKIDALVAYREFRPLGVGHGEVTKQWLAMTKAINDMLPDDAVPFAKQTIITKFHDLMEQYKGNFTEREVSKSSGRNRFDTDEEREAYTTWQMVS